MRVFINGFGRIGRSVLRAWAEGSGRWPGLEVVGINDIAAPEMCAYLFEYDSVLWPLAREGCSGRRGFGRGRAGNPVAPGPGPVSAGPVGRRSGDGMHRAGRRTGGGDAGPSRGAGRVLISGPSSAAEVTVVLGANDGRLADQRIVSNASCTTNALAPLARLIHERWGIVTGSMTTVHCYTGSQPTVDAPAADPARSRAAALSMVPTTTSAARLLDGVLPELAGRIVAQAVRVPVASVSCVDFHLMTEARPSVEQVNAAFREAARSDGSVIGVTDRPLVSSDLRARGESVVMACPETKVTAGGMLRVFGWYDNEWGFSNRMLDMALRMG